MPLERLVGQPLVIGELLYRTRHGLIDESLHARMGAETTNGDGFGRCARATTSAGRDANRVCGRCRRALHYSGDHRFLAVEVAVEGAEADVRLVGDLVDAGAVDPMAREHPPCGFTSLEG